ncbi:MAG: hypothetical protein QM498_01325 [Desulfobacterium sp.]
MLCEQAKIGEYGVLPNIYLPRMRVKDKGYKKDKAGYQKKEATHKSKKITGSDTGYPIE